MEERATVPFGPVQVMKFDTAPGVDSVYGTVADAVVALITYVTLYECVPAVHDPPEDGAPAVSAVGAGAVPGLFHEFPGRLKSRPVRRSTIALSTATSKITGVA